MKLSKETVQILKQFATYNENFQVKPNVTPEGKTLIGTKNADSTIFITSEIEEKFDKTMTLFRLPVLLQTVALLGDDHEIELHGSYLTVKSPTRQQVRINYAEPDTLVLPKTLTPNLPPFDVNFVLSKEDLTKLTRFADLFDLPQIKFSLDDTNALVVEAFDDRDPSKNSFKVELAEKIFTSNEFVVCLKRDMLKFSIDGDYRVGLSSGKLVRFESQSSPTTYIFPALLEGTSWNGK